jgi:hypothetical protein
MRFAVVPLAAFVALGVPENAVASEIFVSFASPGAQTINAYPLAPDSAGQRIIPATAPQGLTTAGGKLYWIDGTTVYDANLDGTGVTTLLNLGVAPTSIAVSASDNEIFVSFNSPGAQTINVYPLVPDAVGQRLISATAPTGLTIAGGKLYWIDGTTVYGANLDGTGITTLLSLGIVPTSIAVDAADSEIFASFDSPGAQTIDFYPLEPDAAGQRLIAATAPEDLTIAGGKLYWIDGASIFDANLDGSGLGTLLNFGVVPTSIAVFDSPVIATSEPPSMGVLLLGFAMLATPHVLAGRRRRTAWPATRALPPS